MNQGFTPSHLSTSFPTDDACLEEIKKLRYPQGIACGPCYKVTKHYKVEGRATYSCEFCRHQVYPLKGTIFEKSTTPLRLWFFCMLLMTTTRGKLSAKQIQHELGVTYKTAWRMRHHIFRLMKQNHGDLLTEPERVISVSFFNAFALKIVNKQETL
jgi:transposase